MKFISYLSLFLIPMVIFYIIVYAALQKKPVFELFLKGVKQGFLTVVEIAPTIIGLLVAVGIFRSSGVLDFICNMLKPLENLLPFPIQILPLALLKMFSASGANALLFDIFKNYGTDSYVGFSASILLCCTETLFYTISVYFMSVKIKKTRWVVPVGILLSLVSLILSALIARMYV